jgi:large subunit ribosomal protein L25
MTTTLAAEARAGATGKGVARKLRAQGRVPAVVYSQGGTAESVTIEPHALSEIFRKTQDRNTIVHVEVGGTIAPCMVKEVQRHPLSRAIEHVDFYRLTPGQRVEVVIPVQTTGKSIGVSAGGKLRVIRREVVIDVPWEHIPTIITHDITAMDLGDFVKASQLAIPPSAKIVGRHDYNVISVFGKRAPAVAPAAKAPEKKKK